MWRLPLALLLLELSQSIPLVSPTYKPKADVPKNGRLSSQAPSWHRAPQGSSCDDYCETLNMECSEATILTLDSQAAVSAAVAEAGGTPCDPRYPEYGGMYAAEIVGGMCLHLIPGLTDDHCGTASGLLERICPCYTVQAFGDPHLSNMNGDFFDITREGINNFLLLHAEENGTKSEFRVDALIDHPGEGSRCSGFFIRRLTITSPLIGKDIEVSTHGTDLFDNKTLTVKVGEKEMLSGEEVVDFLRTEKPAYNLTFDDARPGMRLMHPKNRIKFATLTLNLNGAEFVIEWRTGLRKPNILEFRASNLGALGSKWSGLLAFDDHTFVSSYDPDCKKSSDYGQMAQLTEGTNNRDQAWRASASM